MEPVALIVTALAAGAAAALQDGVKDAVRDGYKRLRDAVRKRPDGELALERHGTAPEKWERVLTAGLSDVGAGGDDGLVKTARDLMKLIDEAGARAGKYDVTIHGGQGVQVGDHNTQTNTFTNS